MNRRHFAPEGLDPSGDNLSYAESGGLAAVNAGVEYSAVDELAGIVDGHAVAGGGLCSVAFFEHFVLQTGRSGLHFNALAVFEQEVLSCFFVDSGHSGSLLLLLLLQLGEELIYNLFGFIETDFRSEAVIYSGYAVGKILYVYFFNAGAAEIMPHAETKSIAQTVEIFCVPR